jgi:type II secretory pathway component PulL
MISIEDQAAWLVKSAEWWARLTDEQRARYDAMRAAAPLDVDEPPDTRAPSGE